MGLLDLFKSRESREKLCHLRNLVAVAVADGYIEKKEMAALAMIMSRDGLTPSDFERCINNPHSIKAFIPESYEKKVEYLTDMCVLMMCDGHIDEREMAICKLTASALGFPHEIIDEIVHNYIEEAKRKITW